MQKLKYLTILFILTTLLVVAGGSSPDVLASPDAVAPNLGSAASFVGLAHETFTNTGSGVYVGDVGSPQAPRSLVFLRARSETGRYTSLMGLRLRR